jgi:carbon monoxide dehydrogenase subunit G
MAEFGASIIIDRPVDVVWKFVTDLSNAPKCFVNTVEMRQTSPGPLRVGSTVSHRFYKSTCTGHVTEYEPNRKFTTEATSGPIKGSKEVVNFESIDGKTRLTYTAYWKLSRFYKPMWPFVIRSTVKQGKAETASKVDNIKRILESEARAVIK